ncbi:MAG: hypothetical protein KJ893_04740 [Candidatus Omnitrophica bacterium]|nr:hypothetical protein [Candidatus Omnitrophota bacterium]MCG2703645.1 hypothetical protein [Candidatus Omnitrophota bacterium]
MNKLKKRMGKFISWFFEEEAPSSEPESPEENITISLGQAVMLIAVTLLFLWFILYSYFRDYFPKPVFTPEKYIEAHIEKNYFKNGNAIKNGDFSNGLNHWKTADGGKLFKESESRVLLENNGARSAPSCMKIVSISPANRYFYSKEKTNKVIDDPYKCLETAHWLGVPGGATVKASLWYKGDIVRFLVQCLQANGDWRGIGDIHGNATDTWKRLEITAKVPENGRAIALEITLNRAIDMPAPQVCIDDVAVSVE